MMVRMPRSLSRRARPCRRMPLTTSRRAVWPYCGWNGEARARIASEERDEAERSRQLAVLGGRIAELHERIAGARVGDTGAQPHDEVRFGATVTLRTLSGTQAGEVRRYTLVGVDEAAVAEGRVAFTAPIARAISGCVVGDKVVLRTAQGEQELEIAAIEYK